MTGSFRLVRLRGRHGKDEWPLSAGRETVLGRRGAQGRVPDVDLSVDRHVSRSHARVWFAGNNWWLEDLGSKHGTRVAHRPIEPKQPVRLDPGVEIELGRTGLSLFPPHWHRLNAGEPAAVAGKLAQALRSGKRSQGPSRHYREALALAKTNAHAEGSMLVQQQHMLAALLACHSVALEDALTRLGTDRPSLQSALERFDLGRGVETPDASVFLAPQAK
jgi:pSer/pThr/pTyr-binding forkhead associated (FHA) protein